MFLRFSYASGFVAFLSYGFVQPTVSALASESKVSADERHRDQSFCEHENSKARVEECKALFKGSAKAKPTPK